MTIDQGLKACPFCGGTDVKTFGPYGWYRQWCISHSCASFYNGTSEMMKDFPTEAAAIAAWNTRTPSPSLPSREAIALVERLKARLHDSRHARGNDGKWVVSVISDELEAILSLLPATVPLDTLEAAVDEAMLAAWDDISSETGRHPLDIRLEGETPYFSPGHWARTTAMYLQRILPVNEWRTVGPEVWAGTTFETREEKAARLGNGWREGVEAAAKVVGDEIAARWEEARLMRLVPGGGPGSAYDAKARSIEDYARKLKRLLDDIRALSAAPLKRVLRIEFADEGELHPVAAVYEENGREVMRCKITLSADPGEGAAP